MSEARTDDAFPNSPVAELATEGAEGESVGRRTPCRSIRRSWGSATEVEALRRRERGWGKRFAGGRAAARSGAWCPPP